MNGRFWRWNGISGILVNVLIATSAALAADCDTILRSNLFNESKIVDQQQGSAASASDMCSMTYQEARSSGSFNAGGSYKFFSADVGSSESSFNSWKQQNCASHSASAANSSFRYQAQKALAADVVVAWKECMIKREGLSCFASPDADPRSRAIVVAWNVLSPSLPVVERSTLLNARNRSTPETPNQLYARGSTLYAGESRFLIEIQDEKQAPRGEITVIHERFRQYSCDFYIPAVQEARAVTTPQEKAWQKLSRENREKVQAVNFINENSRECQSVRARLQQMTIVYPSPRNAVEEERTLENEMGRGRVINALIQEGRNAGCVQR